MNCREQSDQPDVVVTIDEHRAVVAAVLPGGAIERLEIRRGDDVEARFLAHVVHQIGDRERVLIIGRSDLRLALEREFVALNHRPERLLAAPHEVRGIAA